MKWSNHTIPDQIWMRLMKGPALQSEFNVKNLDQHVRALNKTLTTQEVIGEWVSVGKWIRHKERMYGLREK